MWRRISQDNCAAVIAGAIYCNMLQLIIHSRTHTRLRLHLRTHAYAYTYTHAYTHTYIPGILAAWFQRRSSYAGSASRRRESVRGHIGYTVARYSVLWHCIPWHTVQCCDTAAVTHSRALWYCTVTQYSVVTLLLWHAVQCCDTVTVTYSTLLWHFYDTQYSDLTLHAAVIHNTVLWRCCADTIL